ncbi:hypothetical protein [Aeromicrobium sp.]|uniref:hypothetical protein n=1 Tax=Aeromicrobium sp. TaxID=1871063 RepID=UPI0019B2B753|nr:hypothetical protein [Aeromicrobium sp.]MBC7633690.1 hypothetical protein [Aeromicrobium sp.]
MDTPRTDHSTEHTASPDGRVRVDLVIGATLLSSVVVGKLLWQASDLGIVAALTAR